MTSDLPTTEFVPKSGRLKSTYIASCESPLEPCTRNPCLPDRSPTWYSSFVPMYIRTEKHRERIVYNGLWYAPISRYNLSIQLTARMFAEIVRTETRKRAFISIDIVRIEVVAYSGNGASFGT